MGPEAAHLRVRLTPHAARLAKRSSAVAAQLLPSDREQESDAFESTVQPCAGKADSMVPGFERLYEDRVLLRVTDACAAHCRFCFERNEGEENGFPLGLHGTWEIPASAVAQAVERLRAAPEVRSVTVSGGSPLLLGEERLLGIVRALADVDTIRQIYVAMSRPIFTPELWTSSLARGLAALSRSDPSHPRDSRRVAASVHINHPDELTEAPEVVEALDRFVRAGVPLYNQTTLLRGINDEADVLEDLHSLLVANGVLPYYLVHCMPIRGAGHFRTTVQRGIDILRCLERSSGHERPHYIVVTEAGKVQLCSTSALRYEAIEGRRFVVLPTPYPTASFLRYEVTDRLPPLCRDECGLITARYLDGAQDVPVGTTGAMSSPILSAPSPVMGSQ